MMMTLFETTSNFVIAFTNTLIHSLWMGAIFILIIKALLILIKDRRSGIRYRISTTGMLLFILSTIVLFTQLYTLSSPSEIVSANTSLKSLFLLAISPVPGSGEIYTIGAYYPILLHIYIIGLCLFILRWIISALQIRNIINKGNNIKSSEVAVLESLKLRLGITRNIRLLSSEKLNAPVLFGLFRPVIIVPAGMFFHLPHQQVESILMHELVHVKRFDYFINILQSVVEMIFFFNPFVWMISKQIRTEREKSCDDQVVNSGSSPSVYAKALLNISIFQTDKYDLAVSVTGNNRKVLLERIHRLLNINTMKTRNKQKAFFTYLIVVSFIVVFITSGFRSSFFTINKGAYGTMDLTEIATDFEDNTVDASIDHHLPLSIETLKVVIDENELCLQDTNIVVSLDTLTDEQWEQYRQSLEEAYEELKNIDWEAEKEEFYQQRQEMLADMEFDREQFERDLLTAKEEMKNLNKEEILLQIEEAKLHMDSVKKNIDLEKMEQELEFTIQEMEINIQDILVNIEESIEDLDFDFDFDFDFDQEFDINFDSIMKNAQMAIDEINFEEIRQNIEEAMQKLEKEMQEMDDDRQEKNDGE